MFWMIEGALVILGAAMGSFACCQAWRMRYAEMSETQQKPAKVEGAALGKWSVCLHCGRRLKWYDNMPVVSWLVLRGRCRYCGEKIGWAEIGAEVSLAVVFGMFGWYFLKNVIGTGWTVGPEMWWGKNVWTWVRLGLWLVILTGMWILLIYDAKWGRLPVRLLIGVNVLALVEGCLRLASEWQGWAWLGEELVGVLAGVILLAGVYFVLYKVSDERWVGGGDWWLALAIAVLLGDWWLAMVELLVANVLALVAMVLLGHQKQVAMGPFLIIGMVIIFLLQGELGLALL